MSNGKKYLVLSRKNIASHRGLYAKIAVAFACLIFMVCLFSTYAIALTQSQQNTMDESASSNYYLSRQGLTIEGAEEIIFYSFDFTPLKSESDDAEGIELYSADIIVVADGETHGFNNDAYGLLSINIYGGERLFTQNDYTELNTVFELNSLIIGEMPSADGEIAISQDFLAWYGLTEDIIGKRIQLCADDGQSTAVLSATVSGIIRSEYYELSGHISGYNAFYPTIFVYGRPQPFDGVYGLERLYMYSLFSWPSSADVAATVQSYNCSFAGTYIVERIELVGNLRFICVNFFIIIGLSLGIGLVLMIFIMVDRLVRTFSRDAGIYLTCGLSRRELNKLLYVIVLWICLFAAILAAVLTVCGFYAIRAFIESYFRFIIVVTFSAVTALFAAGIAIVLIIATAFYFGAVMRMRQNTIKELLVTQV